MPPVFRKNRLAFFRLVKGIEQQELARFVGVSSVTVSNWERDIWIPTKDHADQVARFLKIPVRKLWPHEEWKA